MLDPFILQGLVPFSLSPLRHSEVISLEAFPGANTLALQPRLAPGPPQAPPTLGTWGQDAGGVVDRLFPAQVSISIYLCPKHRRGPQQHCDTDLGTRGIQAQQGWVGQKLQGQSQSTGLIELGHGWALQNRPAWEQSHPPGHHHWILPPFVVSDSSRILSGYLILSRKGGLHISTVYSSNPHCPERTLDQSLCSLPSPSIPVIPALGSCGSESLFHHQVRSYRPNERFSALLVCTTINRLMREYSRVVQTLPSQAV